MKRIARVDDNQSLIVDAARSFGCSIQHLHGVGQGCPDLLIGFRGINILAEIKDGSKPPSRQRLTPDEALWHDEWNGQVAVITSVDDLLRLIEELTT